MLKSQRGNRRARFIVGLILAVGLLSQYQRATTGSGGPVATVAPAPVRPGPAVAFASPAPERPVVRESLEEQAARDPVGFLDAALDRYDRTVRDYTCTFTKQERLGSRIGEEQVISAMYREKPHSVRFEWIKNEDKAHRVLYVKDRWVDENQQQLAVVEPGVIARLFVSHVMRPIHGEDARKSSRRTIDQFGVRSTLELTLKYCRLAEKKGILDLKYKGTSEVDKRETLVFERRLPYTNADGPWPDRVLEIHIDKELILPTLCLCYADDEKKVLLGKYMTTDIKLNVNLPDSVFTKKGMGL